MWVLEAEGDVLQGKRVWLRPGKKFLFGRTKADAGQFVISDKMVSRRHLTVEVDEVRPSDCANIRTRSRVTLVDLDTKIGTLVNGEQIRGKAYVLDQDRNIAVLARSKCHLIFTWVPITLTFSFGLKEAKSDPYQTLYELLGPLDIKVLVEYQCGLTTHLAAKRRNTPKGLQALIDGRFIVHSDTFINAIIAAATPVSQSEEDGDAKSSLEEDWDANFPDPLKYLPPRGEEPTLRDDSAYAPNPDRKEVFEGYTFIFYEKRQFETLLSPITEGRGKALYREVIPDETEVEDFVRYVKGVAGEKGLGEFEDGSEGRGVVVVRFNPVKGPGTEWFADFNRQVALYLDHRLIEQNEFLDAILGNDASGLRRPLELEPSGVMAPPPSIATSTSQTLQSSQLGPGSTQAPAQAAPPEPARRARSRRTAATRFKGFDDDDDDKVSAPVNLSSIPEAPAMDESAAGESQSLGLFISQDLEMGIDHEGFPPVTSQTRSGRKRVTPPMEYEEEEDIVDQLAPAAAALKKRRLAEQTARRRRGESTPPPSIKQSPEPKSQLRSKKIKKEIDLLEVARQQREKAEELAIKEREALQEAMNGMDIEAIRNLTIIEEMEVIRRPPPLRAVQADESDRWDDRWNGRKNFKKFRRRGMEDDRIRDFHRVIVPLEEVKKKDFGIGDEYWLDDDSQRRKRKGKGQETQDAFQSQSSPAMPKRGAATRAADILANETLEEQAQPAEDVDEFPSDLEVLEQPPQPPAAVRSQRSQRLEIRTSPSQKTSASNKRPAATSLTKAAPAKKARQTATKRKDESDDSGDEFKFRFRKRN